MPAQPEDRYSLAGGCYAVRSLAADPVLTRAGGGSAATTDDADAPPRALPLPGADLGRYLLYGAVGSTSPVTRLAAPPRAPARRTSPAADWQLDELGDWRVDTRPPASRSRCRRRARLSRRRRRGHLVLTGRAAALRVRAPDGLRRLPRGRDQRERHPSTGATPYGEVTGFLDAHMHMMAFEFLGGRAHCGRPWHRYGVTVALVDCPDHEPQRRGRGRWRTRCPTATRRHARPGRLADVQGLAAPRLADPRADVLQLARAGLARRPAAVREPARRQRRALRDLPVQAELVQRDGQRPPAGAAASTSSRTTSTPRTAARARAGSGSSPTPSRRAR